jgi:putative PEP-CTERM system TPR-repeat lipoprotein
MALKDTGAAIQSLQKAIAIQPNFLEGQRALVALYMGDKRSEEALTVARTMQKQRPKEDLGYLLEADIQASSKSWDKALSTLRTGLAQTGTTPVAMKLHSALQEAGKGPEAGQFSTQWQKEHPKDAAFLFHLGDMALARKDYSVAEQNYAAVLKLQPDNAITLNNLAWVEGKLKKDGAITHAEKAVALAPDQPVFLDTLAGLQSEKGNHARAVELQNKALLLQPGNPLLKLNLARIYLRGGQKEQAKKPLDELSRLGDAFPGQGEVATLRKELAQP